MRREDRRFVRRLFLTIGLVTLALPDPGRLLLAGRYVPADANEILAGLVLVTVGIGHLARSAEPRRPASGE